MISTLVLFYEDFLSISQDLKIPDFEVYYVRKGLKYARNSKNLLFSSHNFSNFRALCKAVKTLIRSSFLNQGEICLCTSRIYVHDSVYDNFLQQFIRETQNLKVGDPNDPEVFMGALNSKIHLEKVIRYLCYKNYSDTLIFLYTIGRKIQKSLLCIY